MKAPISWLRDFVDIDEDIKRFCNLMTVTGTKVEGYNQAGAEISGVVTVKSDIESSSQLRPSVNCRCGCGR